ncbi:M23 family peptidase [Sphingobacteriales bacterium UPWRP_1]|nr:hypothetical protein BVG80_17065 [Sphingobacteriales bacterium TSM_CSM]PSJ74308.1 M23 family peptidase [Sphingobacteriales bacterium UPWRP_1]
MSHPAKRRYIVLLLLFAALLLPLLLPGSLVIPVQNATPRDWNANSFWHYPWGVSGVHKGIDIFAPKGRPVLAAGSGLVVYSGQISLGGNVVLVLGAKWRLHYYAHLQNATVQTGQWVWQGSQLGFVGNTGNAAGKPPHLHYSVASLLPYVWRRDNEPQGWRKMFYLNPHELLMQSWGK